MMTCLRVNAPIARLKMSDLTMGIIHFVMDIDKCVFAFPVELHFQRQKTPSCFERWRFYYGKKYTWKTSLLYLPEMVSAWGV